MDFSAEMEVFKVSDDGYFEDVDAGTLYTSAPTSPRHAFSKEVIEAPLGEVLAAIPFAWEVVPGTPKLESGEREHFSFSDETTQGSSSPSSSGESSARESTEFEFSNRISGETVSAEELFAKGQLVTTSLRLPPRLQAVKHRDSDVSSCDSSSFKSYSSPQSSPRGFCGFTKTADEETTTMSILGMQEHNKRRSLSPLRFFHRESSFSSNSSSSSSSPSSNASSPDSVTLKQLMFPDSPMASTPKPPITLKEAALTPQFSRSNAKSRRAPVELRSISARKENIGRVLFASRFGMLSSCLGGMAPGSP